MTKVLKASELEYEISKLSLERLVTFNKTSPLSEVISTMFEKNFGSVGIEENGKLIGILTEKDFLSKISISKKYILGQEDLEISSLMTSRPVVLDSSSTLLRAMAMMSARDFRHIPILNENGEYSMLSVRDVLDQICLTFKDELSVYKAIKYWDKANATLQEDEILEHTQEANAISEAIFQTPLKRIYKNHINTLDVNLNVAQYLDLLHNADYFISFVMEYETLFRGIITERDVLKKIFTKQIEMNDPITDLMTPNPDVLSTQHCFGNAIKNMQEFNYRNMPIVNQEGLPIGNVTLLDLLSLFASFIVA